MSGAGATWEDDGSGAPAQSSAPLAPEPTGQDAAGAQWTAPNSAAGQAAPVNGSPAAPSVPPPPGNPMTTGPAGAMPPGVSTKADYFAMARGVEQRATKDAIETLGNVGVMQADAAQAELDALDTQGQHQQAVHEEFMNHTLPQHMKEANDLDSEFQKNVKIGQQRAEQQMQKVLQSAQAVQDFQFHDYWEDKANGAKALGLIAQALGGAANGLAGNPSAPTAMDRIIERDMQLQQANFAKAKAGLEANNTVYGALRENLSDQLSVNAAFRTALNQKFAQQIDIMGLQMNVPADKIAVVKAQLMTQNATNQAKLAEQMVNIKVNGAHAESGIYLKQADWQQRYQDDLLKQKQKAGQFDQKLAAKQSDVQLAITRIDEALKNPNLTPADQQMLAESYATALNNSTTRGPRKDEREVQQAQVSGTALPHYDSINLNEWKTKAFGMDKATLHRMRNELLEKQIRRQGGQIALDAEPQGQGE